MQLELDVAVPTVPPFKSQLLKWIGNKQRFAHEIASALPTLDGGTYFEPFLGSGAVLATYRPERAVASDAFDSLMGIWRSIHDSPETTVRWYTERYERYHAAEDHRVAYEEIKASYNAAPNPADLLFLSRSCYGGVIRFRKADGYMSTPCGPHKPISPESFEKRVMEWADRTSGAKFETMDFAEAFSLAAEGDVIYCDPPYSDSQTILYGAQAFRLERLLDAIVDAKARGVRVALSIDGTKKSGSKIVGLPMPEGLFEREMAVNLGPSMLKRFQMSGQTLDAHDVSDRLLLTY